MFEKFHTKTPRQIATMTKRFLEQNLFLHFPKWSRHAACIIQGSVANGRYDALSDIDVTLVVPGSLLHAYPLGELKRYKNRLTSLHVPMQLHPPVSFEGIVDRLKDYSRDGDLREISTALIVTDPDGKMRKIQRHFRTYPKPVLEEKLSWLVAEAVFQRWERFDVARRRGDLFFMEVVKLDILRLLLNAYLLADGRYPSFDKHLMHDMHHARGITPKTRRACMDLLVTHDADSVSKFLDEIIVSTLASLKRRHLVRERTRQDWIDLRPSRSVTFG